MNYLAKKLVKLGLSALEGQVYLGLLERRMTTAGALAKHSNLKRSTVYTVLDSLIEKGLVSVTQIEGVKNYQAESPARLKDYLKKKEEEVKAQQNLFGEICDDLLNLQSKEILPPRITIYKGRKGMDNLLMKNLDDEPREVLVVGEYPGD